MAMARARDEALRTPGGPDALALVLGKALGKASGAVARSGGCSSASVEGAGSMAAGEPEPYPSPPCALGAETWDDGRTKGRSRRLEDAGCSARTAPLPPRLFRLPRRPHLPCPGVRPPALCARSALSLEPLRAPRTHPPRAPRGPEAAASLRWGPGAGSAPLVWCWAEEASDSLPRDASRARVYPTQPGLTPTHTSLLLWSQKDLDVNPTSCPCIKEQ